MEAYIRVTCIYFYRPQRSCGQGNIFTPVCHSFCSPGGGGWGSASVHAGIPPPPPRPDTTPRTRHQHHHPPHQTRHHHPPGSRHPPGPDTHPREQTPTPPGADTPLREADSSIRSTSGRYASYWNAFLLCVCYLYSLLHARERAKISSMSPALDRGKLKPLIKTFYLKLSDHKRHQQSSWYNLITSSKMISHKRSLIVFRLLRFHSE